MDMLGGVMGLLGGGGMSSQAQQEVNNAVSLIGASQFQTIFGQLMQTMNNFQETMQDDSDYPNNYD
jgi:predicted lipid-binding transport protein (Tim44 family)